MIIGLPLLLKLIRTTTGNQSFKDATETKQKGLPGAVWLSMTTRSVPFFIGIFPRMDIAVQRGSGYLEHPLNFHNRVSLILEILGNTQLFSGEGFGSAASSPSGSRSCQACLGSLPNQVSFKSNLTHPS
jgi:hypothetical protein